MYKKQCPALRAGHQNFGLRELSRSRQVAGGPVAVKCRERPWQGTHPNTHDRAKPHNAGRRGRIRDRDLNIPPHRKRRGCSKRRCGCCDDESCEERKEEKAFHREPPKFLGCREHRPSARRASHIHSMLILPLEQGTLHT